MLRIVALILLVSFGVDLNSKILFNCEFDVLAECGLAHARQTYRYEKQAFDVLHLFR